MNYVLFDLLWTKKNDKVVIYEYTLIIFYPFQFQITFKYKLDKLDCEKGARKSRKDVLPLEDTCSSNLLLIIYIALRRHLI